tara:strand:- start:123601 stop:124452 length:852 start_codon:yes stop_codon:yes gene_type:complete
VNHLKEIIISENAWKILFEFAKILVVFLLGLFSSFLINRRIKKKKLRRIREFYISWINFSLESVDRQVVLLTNQIKELSDSKSPKLIFNQNQLHKLASINNEELFDAFVLSNKGNSKVNSINLHRLESHIDFLILSIREVKEKFFDTRDKKEVWNQKWSQKVAEFHSIVYQFFLINPESIYVDQILELKTNIDKSYNVNNESNKFFIKNYVYPIKSIFQKQIKDDTSGICYEGFEISESLNMLCMEKEEFFLSYERYLIHYEKELKDTIKKIEEIINYFENEN